MKGRKIVVVLFFVIVFGLPVAWYLFLQAFGENKFDLPRISEWNQSCMQSGQRACLFLDKSQIKNAPNQKNRIAMKLTNVAEIIAVREMALDSCQLPYEMYFVDELGWVRGEYMINREEVDRLMAEIDIYLLNYTNGSSPRNQ